MSNSLLLEAMRLIKLLIELLDRPPPAKACPQHGIWLGFGGWLL